MRRVHLPPYHGRRTLQRKRVVGKILSPLEHTILWFLGRSDNTRRNVIGGLPLRPQPWHWEKYGGIGCLARGHDVGQPYIL